MQPGSEAFAPTDVAGPNVARTEASARDDVNAPTARCHPRDASVALVVGEWIGDRYGIRGYLGEGGMGAVYRAYDAVLGEEVALKVVRGELADQTELRDEVRIAQQVTHRNVCRTYDLEDIGGRHFVKMEYIQGDTLAARIATVGRLSIASAVAITRGVAEGLAAAHAQGIAHRDLKPGNVMLCGSRVVLMDFGLARKIDELAGERAGTPAYMSPEQLAGTKVDERTDLFALGCLVFEMLVGERAFTHRGTFTELATHRAEQRAPDVRTKRRDTPRWLARAVAELLSPDPAARPKGKARLLRGPGPARILVAIAAAVLAAAAAWGLTRPSPPWQPAVSDLQPYIGNADSPVISPDGTTLAYAGDPGAEGRWGVFVRPLTGGAPRQISTPGTNCEGPRWMRDGRAILMRCFVDAEWRIVRQPLAGAPHDLGPGICADDCGGSMLVSNGSTLLRRTSDGHEIEVARVTGNIIAAVCDRGGNRVAFIEDHADSLDGDLYVVEPPAPPRRLAGSVDSLAFTPGGRSIVYARTNGETSQLFEISPDGDRERGLAADERHARAPEVSSDGATLVFHRDVTSQFLSELGPAGSQPRTFQTSSLDYVTPTRRGEVVLAESQDDGRPSIISITISDGTVRQVALGQVPFLSHDESRLLFRASDDPGQLRSTPIAGGPVTSIARLDGVITDGVDAVDGQHLALERAGTCEAWRIPRGGGPPVPEGVTGLVLPAPSGGWRAIRTCATGGPRFTIRFVAPGQPLSVVAFEREGMLGRPTWVDDRHFAYCDHEGCRVVDVDQVDGEPLAHRFGIDDEYAIAPGAMRWFTTREAAQVSLHQITNFDRRPWQP